jgi:hypothetical protein
MILDEHPVPLPPPERPWLVAAGAAIGLAFATAVGTKLGEWIVDELRTKWKSKPEDAE